MGVKTLSDSRRTAYSVVDVDLTSTNLDLSLETITPLSILPHTQTDFPKANSPKAR